MEGGTLSRPLKSGRQMVSRITAPFSSKVRPLSDFYIRPREPHRHYSQGDTVQGGVVLTVAKPIRVTHLVVSLHGFVRVFKSGVPGQGFGENASRRPDQAKGGGLRQRDGYTSIFQEEKVLCGEGRLDAGAYEFEFEMDFPSSGLPSSVDFERGTISYSLVATLTRPTPLAPTTSCDRKLRFVEVIDIGTLRPPKPRKISLEPIARRSKLKNSAKGFATSQDTSKEPPPGAGDSRMPTGTAEACAQRSSAERNEAPHSPATSVRSVGSVRSGSTGSAPRSTATHAPRSSHKNNDQSSVGSTLEKTITANVELLRTGCLRGDLMPLRISVSHTKPIKSLHGVIITFFRQSRIDSRPLSTSGQDALGRETDDYYAKSKSGLAGLSLSSPGTSSVFRKDLSQTFAPLIIDPRTMTTTVKASVRVPEDAFPTISSVPGGMISFTYFIEVVLDLSGKLAGQDNFLPQLGMMNVASSYAPNAHPVVNSDEGINGMLSTWGGSVVDTHHIRREKSVVACQFEVVLGTMDSSRLRLRPGKERTSHEERWGLAPQREGEGEGKDEAAIGSPHEGSGRGNGQIDHSHMSEAQSSFQQGTPPALVPPALLTSDEDQMDEKSRLRQAEATLLPSQPPQPSELPSTDLGLAGPSAPVIDGSNEVLQPSSAWNFSRTASGVDHPEASNPVCPPGVPSRMITQHHATPTDDKRELHLRQLQAAASSPEHTAPDQGVEDELSTSPARIPGPSAPLWPVEALDEPDQEHSDIALEPSIVHHTDDESLPKYER
ncbi:MAG: ph-response sensor protein [Piccolia ochrophora]|nr:MAG: ph-response sensor protein [Piccolia ochrophora]